MTTIAITPHVLTRVRIELLRRGWTQLDLAKQLRHPHSTLSSWLRGVAPAPSNLLSRIERALKLPAGALTSVDEFENKV
jgi:transcriptional regulator with XRE-family HTH domain